MEVSGQLHIPAALPSRERAPGTFLIGGWMGSRVAEVFVNCPNPSEDAYKKT